MKIAFFHELHAGGARRASNEFSRILRDNNTVDLFLVDEKQNKTEEKFYNNVYYYPFEPRIWNGGDWKGRLYKDSIELFKLNGLHKKIAKEIDQQNYDVILVFPSRYTQAPFVLKFLKTRTVFFAMEPLRIVYDPTNEIPKELPFSRFTYEWVNRLNRKLLDKVNLDKADSVIGPSKYSARFSSRVYKKKVEVAYLGVNTTFFTNSKSKRNIDVLFIGSKDKFDGYEFFKDVVKKVKTKIHVREVLFENEWLSDVQIRDLYRNTKILVASSYKELLGLIPLEAMGCGVVVLAVDEAGYRETIIDGENGYLINREASRFAGKIDELLNNDTLLKKMSNFASENFHKVWDWKVRGKELEKILKKS